MSVKELVNNLNLAEGYKCDIVADDRNIVIRTNEHAEDIVTVIKEVDSKIRDYNTNNENQVILMFDLKGATTCQKIEAIKYAFNTPTLEDPLMQLNLYNLIKSYNNMNDEFFNSSDVYFNSVEELLDVKLALSKEIKAFIRQLSIYYMSLFKSYNKLFFTPSDEHINLPTLYKNMILTSDLLTLSGIFAKSPEFSTNDLIYIDDAYIYLTALITRSNNSMNLIDDFLNSIIINEEVK